MKQVIRKKPYLIPLFIIIGIGAIALFGWAVMALWNAALVPAAGANIISFWQALGLLVLSRILVGGFGGGRKVHRRGNQWQGKWTNMTPDEKAQFRQEWKQQCGKGFDSEKNMEQAAE
jgi:Ca2+/H+ antiporter, TMEM165/GDT1 family